jgi:hypothetical protein
MRRVLGIFMFFLGLALVSPVWAGTGGAEDPSNGNQDVDQALRTAVRWILSIKGLKVIQSERTADFNEYRIDQKASGGAVMKSIADGLNQRKWKVTSKQDAKSQVIEASKDGKKLKVSLAKSGKEPRLTVEIKKIPPKKAK